MYVFTALHGMQKRSSDENSLCLSSVKCVDCDKMEERSVQRQCCNEFIGLTICAKMIGVG